MSADGGRDYDAGDEGSVVGVDTLFDIYRQQEALVPGVSDAYVNRLRTRMRTWRVIRPLCFIIERILSCCNSPSGSCGVLLVGDVHLHHFVGREKVLLVSGPGVLRRRLLSILRNVSSWRCYDFMFADIINSYRSKMPATESLRFALKYIKQHDVKVLLTGNDTKPLERIWITAARLAGIPSMVYQHGVWVSKTMQAFQADGWFSDQVLVYDEYHERRLLGWGMDSSKIHVVGFPAAKVPIHNGAKCVCLVGSAGFSFGKGELITSINTAVAKLLAAEGYEVFYRPHPIERRNGMLEIGGGVKIAKLESVSAAIEKYAAFVGITSTMLVEANIAGRRAIQVSHPDLAVEPFGNLGYGLTLSVLDDDFAADLVRAVEPVPSYRGSQRLNEQNQPSTCSVCSRCLQIAQQ